MIRISAKFVLYVIVSTVILAGFAGQPAGAEECQAGLQTETDSVRAGLSLSSVTVEAEYGGVDSTGTCKRAGCISKIAFKGEGLAIYKLFVSGPADPLLSLVADQGLTVEILHHEVVEYSAHVDADSLVARRDRYKFSDRKARTAPSHGGIRKLVARHTRVDEDHMMIGVTGYATLPPLDTLNLTVRVRAGDAAINIGTRWEEDGNTLKNLTVVDPGHVVADELQPGSQRVVTMLYLPVDEDNELIDPNADPGLIEHFTGLYENFADVLRDWTQRQIDIAIDVLNDGSRFRGYDDAAVPGSLQLQHWLHFERSQPLPYRFDTLSNGDGLSDMKSILNGIDICDLVDNHDVREVWIFKLSANPTHAHPEFYIASPTFDHAAVMTWLKTAAPICNKTYNIVVHDTERFDLLLHAWYHSFEATLKNVDEDNFDLWAGPCEPYYNCYPGGADAGTVGRCGNVHIPPNGRSHYDLLNETPAPSDCKDFNPDGPGGYGQISQISCHEWNCNGEMTIESNSTVNFVRWNLQNLPGLGNTITRGGVPYRNWWDGYLDFDGVRLRGESLFQP